MPEVGQELDRAGLRLRFEQIDPDLLVMDASYEGNSQMPPAHLHPNQAEHFTVLEGRMHTVIGGIEHTYEPGDEFEVPVGVLHQMSPLGPTRMRWEVRPSLRTAEFFERLATGQVDASFLDDFKNEIRFVT
jgi:hypothetical protein